ncbi:hypothetical protein CC85DRAFT_305745 [Cutaneotrichosporon oleaginosum]|uniref:Uncharacterized protein n=1 Tax=Cutaneotrichosporon oleaginosum TaxID=879819 RepID=A0A0J0XCB7_9TREE|nr:uncharacterized protein CC85DRAFT_305745 [Cutaneotrichosporon oleaginosum]KLT38692.1 hypothetical protein CC85DRAFT_305745 [Cutaneotrichosporon oleaginosum]TXT08273.1 hypothetical protein COLE_05197 [Cutaneotrichosporon oleaginosum]
MSPPHPSTEFPTPRVSGEECPPPPPRLSRAEDPKGENPDITPGSLPIPAPNIRLPVVPRRSSSLRRPVPKRTSSLPSARDVYPALALPFSVAPVSVGPVSVAPVPASAAPATPLCSASPVAVSVLDLSVSTMCRDLDTISETHVDNTLSVPDAAGASGASIKSHASVDSVESRLTAPSDSDSGTSGRSTPVETKDEEPWAQQFYPSVAAYEAARARGARMPRCDGCALTRGRSINEDGSNVVCVDTQCPNFAGFHVPKRRMSIITLQYEVYKKLPRYSQQYS